MPSFHFKGKAFLQNYHHSVKFHKLTPVDGKGTTKKPSLSDNLLVQGDNLKALKALLPTHAGKVKCIYIDPPYNTGKENWIYNDNVASPMIQEWLGKAVGVDDLTRHDKWCCMMYPRLVFLRELLAEDGVIFVSIDDNEVHHLRMMLDEVLGSENFIAQLIWKNKKGGGNDSKHIATEHEYILMYAKDRLNVDSLFYSYNDEYVTRYKEEDSEGKFYWDTFKRKSGKQYYPITCPDGTVLEKDEFGHPLSWLRSEARFKSDLEADEVRFVKTDGGWSVQFKQRLPEGKKPRSICDQWGTTSTGSEELFEIFKDHVFDNPKPTLLIKHLIEIVTTNDDIVLDSFAGSGTTAHAVLALNQEDGGNRRFILVECENYADEITGERIRRVIKGVPDVKDEALRKGLDGSFSYYELGEELEMDKILEGTDLPSYEELARYAFFTATGENWDESKMEKDEYYIGSSSTFEVYMLYEPSKEKLKELALNLDFAIKVQNRFPSKQKLIFAPACFMEEYHLKEYGIRFAQLPFEIYRMAE